MSRILTSNSAVNVRSLALAVVIVIVIVGTVMLLKPTESNPMAPGVENSTTQSSNNR